MKLVKSIVAATLAVSGILAGPAGSLSAEDIAVVGGKTHTMGSDGIVENATVLIKDGKIVSVTAGGAVPEGYRVIDAKGKIVTPGLMNPATTLGLNYVPSWADNNDASFSKGKITTGLDVTWALNPDNVRIPIARVEGLTRAVTGFTSAYPFSGQGAVIHLNGDDLVSRSKAYIRLNVTGRTAGSTGGSRAALWQTVVDTLSKAQKSLPKEEMKADKKRKKKKKKKGAKAAAPKKADANTKALHGVLKGETTLVVQAHEKHDILRALKIKKMFDLKKMVIYGASEAWRVADQLVKADVSVVIRVHDNLPSSFERLGATLKNGARLSKAGVKVMFTGNGGDNFRLMPQHAGNAVANGMSWEEAMKGMTVYPAEVYGISDRYGTLSAGMDADVVVWNGDPLEVMTSPDAILIRGEQVSLTSRQTKLRDRYKELVANPAYRK
ncbi:amidohydrolase family protein [Temperatibacter marinus]|uniref:Amidohydrolase family protein n=1 Tax=Temperatibacter marinus TaxID=1456591 RepID=A0AA52EB03_9PROT|nr:amidohydrolase family protein [Temperatibacter marinus]WND01425.1 amidohydrolase family protein [Temperatibacter marinus]